MEFTAVSSPPPPPPPVYPAGKIPVVFTAGFTFSEGGGGFASVREIRDTYIRVLSEALGEHLWIVCVPSYTYCIEHMEHISRCGLRSNAGISAEDIVIRYIRTVWKQSTSGGETITYIESTEFDTTALFDTQALAEAAAANLESQSWADQARACSWGLQCHRRRPFSLPYCFWCDQGHGVCGFER